MGTVASAGAPTGLRCALRGSRRLVLGLAWVAGWQAAAQSPSGQLQQFFAEGQRAIVENRYADASRALEKARELAPDIPELLASLGFSYFQQGRFVDAAPVLEKAVGLKPGMPNVGLLLAASRSELGRFPDALPDLERAFPTVTDPALKRLAGLQLQRAYSGLGRDSEAVETALRMVKLYPKDPEVLYHAGRLLGHLAYVTVREMSLAAPNSVWTSQAAGEAYESDGQYDRAIAEYRKALELNPRQRGVHYRLGRALLRADGTPDAVDLAMVEFETELRADPTNANAAYELGEIYRQDGDLEQARDRFAQAVQAYPRFEEAQIALGGVLTSLGTPELALAHLRTALSINEGNDVTHYRLAQAYRALGRSDEAQAALNRFQELRSERAQRTAQGVAHEPVTAQRAEPETER